MSQLPEMIQALLQPKAYPEAPKHIELVQTQMSFVFIADDYVYKAKKPVNLTAVTRASYLQVLADLREWLIVA